MSTERVAMSSGQPGADPFSELFAQAGSASDYHDPGPAAYSQGPTGATGLIEPAPAPAPAPAPQPLAREHDTGRGQPILEQDRSASAPIREQRRAAPVRAPLLGRRQPSGVRARQVQRIIRRVDVFSVLKISFLFYVCLWIIVMIAGVILWTAAISTGTIDNVEKFITELGGWKKFEFEGAQLFRASAIALFVLAIMGTGLNVLLAVLFNLISDLVGGIRMTVIEVETRRKPPPQRPQRPQRPL